MASIASFRTTTTTTPVLIRALVRPHHHRHHHHRISQSSSHLLRIQRWQSSTTAPSSPSPPLKAENTKSDRFTTTSPASSSSSPPTSQKNEEAQQQQQQHHNNANATTHTKSAQDAQDAPLKESPQPIPIPVPSTVTTPSPPADVEQQQQQQQQPPPPPSAVSVSVWKRLGPITRAGEAYTRAQKRRPYVTQLISSLTVYFFGDLCAQYISRDVEGERGGEGAKEEAKEEEEEEEEAEALFMPWYNPVRTARALFIGGFSAVPAYRWFHFLSTHFNYPSKPLSVFIKVCVNQSVFTPVFNSYFFGCQSLLSGDNFQQALDRIRDTVPRSCVNSLKLWPAVTAFNFAFIPLQYWALCTGFIAVGWQTYLSYLNRQAEQNLREAAAAQKEEGGTFEAAAAAAIAG